MSSRREVLSVLVLEYDAQKWDDIPAVAVKGGEAAVRGCCRCC